MINEQTISNYEIRYWNVDSYPRSNLILNIDHFQIPYFIHTHSLIVNKNQSFLSTCSGSFAVLDGYVFMKHGLPTTYLKDSSVKRLAIINNRVSFNSRGCRMPPNLRYSVASNILKVIPIIVNLLEIRSHPVRYSRRIYAIDVMIVVLLRVIDCISQ